MASVGAKVLQIRSVEMAMKHRVRLQVRFESSRYKPGTLVVDEDEIMEQELVSGHRLQPRLKRRSRCCAWPIGRRRRLDLRAAGDANINVDMIVQNLTGVGRAELSFSVPRGDLPKALALTEEAVRGLDAQFTRVRIKGWSR